MLIEVHVKNQIWVSKHGKIEDVNIKLKRSDLTLSTLLKPTKIIPNSFVDITDFRI